LKLSSESSSVAFEALADQPHVADLLRRTLAAGRVAHAYAFIGPSESGGATAALAFAQALLCPTGGCGTCRTCALVAARQHPDLHVTSPTPPESNPKGPRAIRIGAIRDLERQASLAPIQAARKVFIIDEADRMTGEAPQAFLKTLEEPPARTVLVLLLSRARAVPATVLSRCQIVRFPPRPAASAREQAEVMEAIDEVRAKGPDALFRRTQAFERDREKAERFVDACWLHCRDLLLARSGAPARLMTDPAAAEALVQEAAAWTEDGLLQAITTCRQARQALAVNVTPRLTLEVVLTHLALRAA
jgi:DNA polymerase III gamma/tau subunit